MNLDLNTVVLLIVAAMNLYSVIIAKRTNTNVALVEKATNSMKDALVAATATASHAEGREEGRTEAAATAATLAAGKLEGSQNKQPSGS
jgi:hypothetical protein